VSKIARFGLFILALCVLAACGIAASSTATIQKFTVTAREFAFDPMKLDVTSGQPVEITLQNKGAIEHDFSIQEIDLAGAPTATGAMHMHDGGHMMSDQPKLHVAAAAGSQGTLTFTPMKAGQYQFYCTVAGHKEAGMVGVLTVKAS
jgi:uncharacterized cupredoxin-like copper-binding protein